MESSPRPESPIRPLTSDAAGDNPARDNARPHNAETRNTGTGYSVNGVPSDDAAHEAAFADWPSSKATEVRGVLEDAAGRPIRPTGDLIAERRGTLASSHTYSGEGDPAEDFGGDTPQVRRVEFQYRYEFRPRTWLGRFFGGMFALVAGAAMLALFAFSFAFVFLPLFALAFLFLLVLVVFQRRGEHKGGSDGSGHGRVRPANAPPDDLVEQQVVRGVLLRKIERR